MNGTKTWSDAKGVCSFMKQGAVAGLFRGEDSTGLMQVLSAGAVRVRRSLLNGYEFGQQKKIEAMFDATDSARATVIHHRKATMGSVSIDNCHPFEHESPEGRYVCGVHNGTIPCAPGEEDGVKFDTDSEWLYYKIAKEGAEKALGYIDYGAYALVWHEQEEDRKLFKIACNGERPFHWAYVKDKNLMLMASEDSMLYWLADRNSLEIDEMFTPKKDVIYTFDTEGELREYKTSKIVKAEKTLSDSYCSSSYVSPYDRPERGGWSGGDVYPRAANTDGVTYRDFHGLQGLEDTPFQMGQQVDFVFQKAYRNRSVPEHWEVRGEVIAHIDGKPHVWNATIIAVGQAALDNIQRADSCWTKVYGLRHEVSTATGLINIMLIVSPPNVIQIDGDDDAPGTELLSLDGLYEAEPEVPWNEDGYSLDDAIGNVLSGRTVRGPGGRYISAAKFMELTRDGCADCTDNISLNQAEETGWHNDQGGPLCSKCVDDWFNSMRAG